MNHPTRREAMIVVAAAGIAAVCSSATPAQESPQEAPAAESADRKRVIDAGMTEDEAECWILLNRALAKFLELPKLHPSFDRELEHMGHLLQKELMMRPAYRRYRGIE